MRINIILFIASLTVFVSSCNGSDPKKTGSNTAPSSTTGSTTSGKTNSTSSSKSGGTGYWQKLVMHEISDGKGGVAAIMPVPSTWKFNVNGVTISGPNNLKVSDFAPKSFMMNYDPNLSYAYSQTPMRAMPEIGQLIQQDVVPSAAKRGLTYVKHYELPDVSKMDKWYSDQLFKAMPMQTFVKAYGIEWKDKNGNMAFTVLHINKSETQQMQTWYYMASLLEVDASAYEIAKKQYVFALENTRYNLEPIMEYNKAEAQRVGQSWAAFNKKMAASQAAFEASQIAHVNKTNAINDAIMSNWKSSNAASDKNQEQFIDRIYENENVQNTETGKTYKVQQGYNQYWMNNDGEYIGTKSNTYNPNLDDNMNDKKWQELKQIKK